MTKKLLVCDCLGTQQVDVAAIERATGRTCSKLYRELCGSQIDRAAKELAEDDVMIACEQESQRFVELAAELSLPLPAHVDIRDRAGWSDQGPQSGAKMAALVAEAEITRRGAQSIDITSDGVCLILGRDEAALQAARDLADILPVTLLLPPGSEIEVEPRFDTVLGTLRQATGTLGAFTVRLDAFQQPLAGGRGAPTLTSPKDNVRSDCDLILDLSGSTPLFPAPEKRDGYVRADPRSAPATAAAVLAASQMVGTFEKPLYVRLEASLCAHSRAKQPACNRCLDVCPTGAITPDGEHVSIDPMICAGCGACAALCPSEAIRYDAPSSAETLRRLAALASAFRKAGGGTPVLLVVDSEHGGEMIRLAARHGRGLPAGVISFELTELAAFGHAEMMGALTAGFGRVLVLAGPKAERDVIAFQIELANALAGSALVALLDPVDPDALSDLLYDAEAPAPRAEVAVPIGTRRQIARQGAQTLQPEAGVIALPKGAPYGAVLVHTGSCSLCLSCVSLCPSGALGDNEDLPQLRFQEDACLQCGLCANICPEDAITLVPQMNLAAEAMTQKVVHEEEPFACIECGALFGTKSTVDKIMEKLGGKHSMFANPKAAQMIQMCDKCRVNAQFHSENNPFAGAERPRPRTTDDYLAERQDKPRKDH